MITVTHSGNKKLIYKGRLIRPGQTFSVMESDYEKIKVHIEPENKEEKKTKDK